MDLGKIYYYFDDPVRNHNNSYVIISIFAVAVI